MNDLLRNSVFTFDYEELLDKKFFNTEDVFNFKIDNDGRRMKLYIKFTKENSEGWKEFYREFCPEKEDDSKVWTQEEFAKLTFFRGLAGLMEDVRKATEEQEQEDAEAQEETPEDITII
jgi:hypothetical protein